MENNMRIFVFGDSFGCNLFEEYYEKNKQQNNNNPTHPIQRYLFDLEEDGIENALWFTDHLKKWGYEVINYALSGSDNETLLYQFHKLENELKEGDRIIIWLSSFIRYNWFDENGSRFAINPTSSPYNDMKDEKYKILNQKLYEQCVNRLKSLSLKYGFIKTNTIPFFNYFLNLHKNYKPILVSFCNYTQMHFQGNQWYFDLENNLIDGFKTPGQFKKTMYEETNRMIDDGHYGRKTNYYYAVAFDEIIKSNLNGNYFSNVDLYKRILDRINTENIEFKLPKKYL